MYFNQNKLKAVTSAKLFLIILASAAFFLVIAFILIFFVWQKQSVFKTTPFSDLLLKTNKSLKLPKNFPQDLPIIAGADLIQAYTRDFNVQDITAIFDSKKSAKENFDFYLDYGKNNGWQIDEAREAKDGKPAKLLLKKDNLIITLVFEEKDSKASKITISSTTLKTGKLFLGPPLPAEENEQKIPATGQGLTNPFLNQPKPKEEKISAKAGETPEGFSQDFPLNGKIKITESYTLKTENQSGATYVIKFKSDQTKQANIKFYQDWFKNNNWLLNNQKPENESTLVSASKPFVNFVEVEITWWQTEADDFELPDAMSEVEVRYREFR